LAREKFSSATESGQLEWEYQQLRSWLQQGKFDPELAARFIHSVISEGLFELLQVGYVFVQVKFDAAVLTPLVWIEVQAAIEDAAQLWQAWQSANLTDFSPNLVPAIKQLSQEITPLTSTVYQKLNQLLAERDSLRELAVKLKRDVLSVTRLLMPYREAGWLDFVAIPDRAECPILSRERSPCGTSLLTQPLIACVDDSPLMGHILKEIFAGSGYRFVAIHDAGRAIECLVSLQPDLILLDLEMPQMSGFQLCCQLRQLPRFQNLPILILTGNDSLPSRLKARGVGPSAFLSKATAPETLLEVIRKHLPGSTSASDRSQASFRKTKNWHRSLNVDAAVSSERTLQYRGCPLD
jgi:chemotaxis family two-component system response regulator PixG